LTTGEQQQQQQQQHGEYFGIRGAGQPNGRRKEQN
jgi:hypothetical protein